MSWFHHEPPNLPDWCTQHPGYVCLTLDQATDYCTGARDPNALVAVSAFVGGIVVTLAALAFVAWIVSRFVSFLGRHPSISS